jgi:hypothetical protein
MRLLNTCFCIAIICIVSGALAVPVAFTNEAEFIAAIDAQGYVYVLEGFEDDEVWGATRSTIAGGTFTAPAITNFSLRFSANNNTSKITTGPGPARTGEWGAFSLPHGSYTTGTNCATPGSCGDGLIVSSAQPMFAFSAWVNGSHGGKLDVILNGNRLSPVGFPEVCDPSGENCVDYGLLSPGHKFFGVLDTVGFTSFELREVEGTAEDQKFIWCDDFVVAFSNIPPPFIQIMSVDDETVNFHFKGLAIHGNYFLDESLSLPSNDWNEVDTLTSSTTETNKVISNSLQRTFFRLRSQ